MDAEGMMISVSERGLVCVHDLNSLLVGPSEHIKFKTTKLIEDTHGGQCAVTRTPDTGFTFLCAAMYGHCFESLLSACVSVCIRCWGVRRCSVLCCCNVGHFFVHSCTVFMRATCVLILWCLLCHAGRGV